MNNGLEEALRVAQIGDLPPEIDKDYKKHWLKAIVKIQRSNGNIGYCLAVNDGNGGANIIRDFNPTGIIVNILSVHPYEEATRNIIPRFANDAQVIKYLCKRILIALTLNYCLQRRVRPLSKLKPTERL